MKKFNYYFTLLLVAFITLFSFFNMFQIVSLSNNVIKIIINNLLPSLLPFMILISLCLSLGLLNLFSYLIQWIFKPLFKLSPIMSSIYFISFFCGYPTNVKMIKEAYELNYINSQELQHLLSIASFASISFIFVSLHLEYPLIIYFCHLAPSIISSGSLQLLQFSHTPLVYSLICFNLSFSGLSVMMQTDNLLDGIDYSFKAYFKARLFHGLCSFTLCLLILTYLL